jgi:hypothetical protein
MKIMEKSMSDVDSKDIIDNIRNVDKNGTLLDVLLEFEKVLDEVGMYAYKNWSKGEIAMGPKLSRYWLHVKVMYQYNDMPDPRAGLRLTKLGCEVKYEQGTLKTPITPKSPEDLNKNGEPKLKSDTVWLVDILMPRKFVDEFTDEEMAVGNIKVDQEAVGNAEIQGLDDATNQQQDI